MQVENIAETLFCLGNIVTGGGGDEKTHYSKCVPHGRRLWIFRVNMRYEGG